MQRGTDTCIVLSARLSSGDFPAAGVAVQGCRPTKGVLRGPRRERRESLTPTRRDLISPSTAGLALRLLWRGPPR